MLLAARGLLTDFSEHFGGMNPAEMVTFVAGQVVETMIERLFARKIAQVIADAMPTRDESRNLLDRDYHLDLFRWREGHIVASVANRFRRGLDEGFEPFEVFRAVQNHAANAARAHVERLVLEAFVGAIESCEDESLRAGLDLVCDLYALENVEADKGFFQEHGRLASPLCKEITRQVNRLCNEVRGHAEALVDAFGIPDAMLLAPIGLKSPLSPRAPR
jgi:acyl-CoA oxidase